MSQSKQDQTLDLKARFASAKSVKAADLNKELESAEAGDMVVCEYGDAFCAAPDKHHDNKLHWVKYNGEDWKTICMYSEWMGSVDETYKDKRRSREELDELRVAVLSLVNVSKLINKVYDKIIDPKDRNGMDYFHSTLPVLVQAIAMSWMENDGVAVNDESPSQEMQEKYGTLVYLYIEEFVSIISNYADPNNIPGNPENIQITPKQEN